MLDLLLALKDTGEFYYRVSNGATGIINKFSLITLIISLTIYYHLQVMYILYAYINMLTITQMIIELYYSLVMFLQLIITQVILQTVYQQMYMVCILTTKKFSNLKIILIMILRQFVTHSQLMGIQNILLRFILMVQYQQCVNCQPE